MKPLRGFSVGVLATALWSSLAHSEEQKNVVQLPPVTVEGSKEAPERTRSESQARKEIQRTPGGVVLISSQEIKETLATALQDVLDFVPGIMVRPRFGNIADESQISIRGSGLRNNYHLRGLTLLLDGFPLNNADGFGDFEAAELLATKRIEVYKGANALRFGVNTLGGAINLETHTGEDNRPFEMRSEGGSFGFMKHSVATGYAAGPFDLQKDQQHLFGGRMSYARIWSLGNMTTQSTIGIETRNDEINTGLFHQEKRQRFSTVNKVHTSEHSLSGYLQQEFFLTEWVRLQVALRGDQFFFDVGNQLPAVAPDGIPIYGSRTDGLVSPKASLILSPLSQANTLWRNTEFFLTFGMGYHSNDARDAVQLDGRPWRVRLVEKLAPGRISGIG